MSNRYVYCVVCSDDGYLEIFENLEDAKKNFIALIGLESAEQAKKYAQRLWDTVAKFYDSKHNQILTPTKDMLFYYQDTTHNFEFHISVTEYVLFNDDELTNFQSYYCFDGCELIKKEIN